MITNLSKNSFKSVSNNYKQLREIVSRFYFCSTESSLGTHLAEILENPTSFTIMFWACLYQMPTVSAISLILNLRSPIIRSHVFNVFLGRWILSRPRMSSAAHFVIILHNGVLVLKLPPYLRGSISPLTLFMQILDDSALLDFVHFYKKPY